MPRAASFVLVIASLLAFGCAERPQPLTKRWMKPLVPQQPVPEGLESLRAVDCGKCHREIYDEWKQSTHARAMIDPQFMREVDKDPIYLCFNCHAPLQNQQDKIVEGLYGGDFRRPATRPNPNFDPELRAEAITCAGCHVRDGAIVGPYGEQEKAPHPVRKATAGELDHKLCATCHQEQAHLGGSLACAFNTVEEWQEGPYDEQGKNCISCHMQEVQRKNSETGEVRPSNRHWWQGGGLGKLKDDEEFVARTFKTSLEVKLNPLKPSYAPGEKAEVQVLVKNAHAGHKVPTGDPERFFTIQMECLSPNGVLETKTERIGQQWVWHPEAKKIGENRLKPLEERAYSLVCALPPDATDVKFRAVVTTHRMTEETQKYHALHDYPIKRELFRLEHPLVAPQGARP